MGGFKIDYQENLADCTALLKPQTLGRREKGCLWAHRVGVSHKTKQRFCGLWPWPWTPPNSWVILAVCILPWRSLHDSHSYRIYQESRHKTWGRHIAPVSTTNLSQIHPCHPDKAHLQKSLIVSSVFLRVNTVQKDCQPLCSCLTSGLGTGWLSCRKQPPFPGGGNTHTFMLLKIWHLVPKCLSHKDMSNGFLSGVSLGTVVLNINWWNDMRCHALSAGRAQITGGQGSQGWEWLLWKSQIWVCK